MEDLFLSRRVEARAELDMVEFRLGPHTLKLFYQTALEIVGGIRLAAKQALLRDGSNNTMWRDLADTNNEPYPILPNATYRRSGQKSTLSAWSVAFEGTLVVLHLDDLTAKFHYSDALQIQTNLRAAARQAKAWAGDKSRTMRASGYLTDAVQNDKLGIR